MNRYCLILLLTGWLCAATQVTAAAPSDADTPLAQLAHALPSDPRGYRAETAAVVRALVPAVERWAVETSFYDVGASSDEILQMVGTLIDIKQHVDRLLERTLALRTSFAAQPPSASRQDAMRSFLASTAALTDLSGRLRYLSVDAFRDAAYDLGADAATREQLIDLFIEKQSAVGAMISVDALSDLGTDQQLAELSGRVKGKVLQLIRDTRQQHVLPELAELVLGDRSSPELLSPELKLLVAHTIRHVGLPQNPRPGRDPTLQVPAITAGQLYDIVAAIDASPLDPAWVELRAGLIEWLDQRRQRGVSDDEYRLGNMTIRAGDWLLMKNPSPYNLFTDLYPGLYTHVGVVTEEMGSDGQRRFVVIDLPETGSTISAVTIDTFVKRSLDYVFLRHLDSEVNHRMAQVAQAVIGNESHFDLNFRTRGIEQLKGQDLSGKKIEGYCAGLLLLCAQETGKPREDFFPVREQPAGGKTLANLAKMDVSMERDFLSPTGPLFSPQMIVAGRSDPMYSPRRQIEQTIYDHFARQMRDCDLIPAHDWYQSMRLKLAEASRNNPSLAQALADAAGVNRNMDLVAAAKLGAVVETLDDIAYGASAEFRNARNAMRIDAIGQLRESGTNSDQIDKLLKYRRRHADLYVRWEAGMITPRQLRIELVDYYIAAGNARLDRRFFGKTLLADSDPSAGLPSVPP